MQTSNPSNSDSNVQASTKTLPEIVETSTPPVKRFVFNCPCTRIYSRLAATWRASKRTAPEKSADLSLIVIALSALGLATAGHFGWF